MSTFFRENREIFLSFLCRSVFLAYNCEVTRAKRFTKKNICDIMVSIYIYL